MKKTKLSTVVSDFINQKDSSEENTKVRNGVERKYGFINTDALINNFSVDGIVRESTCVLLAYFSLVKEGKAIPKHLETLINGLSTIDSSFIVPSDLVSYFGFSAMDIETLPKAFVEAYTYRFTASHQKGIKNTEDTTWLNHIGEATVREREEQKNPVTHVEEVAVIEAIEDKVVVETEKVAEAIVEVVVETEEDKVVMLEEKVVVLEEKVITLEDALKALTDRLDQYVKGDAFISPNGFNDDIINEEQFPVFESLEEYVNHVDPFEESFQAPVEYPVMELADMVSEDDSVGVVEDNVEENIEEIRTDLVASIVAFLELQNPTREDFIAIDKQLLACTLSDLSEDEKNLFDGIYYRMRTVLDGSTEYNNIVNEQSVEVEELVEEVVEESSPLVSPLDMNTLEDVVETALVNTVDDLNKESIEVEAKVEAKVLPKNISEEERETLIENDAELTFKEAVRTITTSAILDEDEKGINLINNMNSLTDEAMELLIGMTKNGDEFEKGLKAVLDQNRIYDGEAPLLNLKTCIEMSLVTKVAPVVEVVPVAPVVEEVVVAEVTEVAPVTEVAEVVVEVAEVTEEDIDEDTQALYDYIIKHGHGSRRDEFIKDLATKRGLGMFKEWGIPAREIRILNEHYASAYKISGSGTDY